MTFGNPRPPAAGSPPRPAEEPVGAPTEIVGRRISSVAHVVTLRGPFLDDDRPFLDGFLRGVVRAGASQLVVDIRELETLSPSCLEVLIAGAERIAAGDGELLLACPGREGAPYHLTTVDRASVGGLRGLHPGLDAALDR